MGLIHNRFAQLGVVPSAAPASKKLAQAFLSPFHNNSELEFKKTHQPAASHAQAILKGFTVAQSRLSYHA